MENAGGIPLKNGADSYKLGGYVLTETFAFLAPLLGVILLGGLAGTFVQGAPRIAFERIAPDLSRISIRSGWTRLFGIHGLIELLKTVAKLGIVGGAIAFSLVVDRGLLTDALRTEPRNLPGLAVTLLVHLTAIVCLTGGVLALAELTWSRFKWRRDLRMSRQELKEEIKQSEGDAFVKARMRSLAQSRARKRMIAAVPRATLVIANPTHFAIALRYMREEGGAPIVLAKGKDLIALKIREVAEQHNIAVFEKKELVRAMYEQVEVDKMIPVEFFRPVAELIHILSRAASR
jgi:flagellar biosynthetic protein FlhB